MEEVCQLLVRQWKSLSVTCPTMEEVCQLLVRQWRKFVSYLTDNGGSLSFTCQIMERFFQLLDRQWRKFLCYLSDNGGIFVFSFFFTVLFYMCNCYWYTFINVHALFHMYMCNICYVIPMRRLHKLVKFVSYPFCLYEQIKLL